MYIAAPFILPIGAARRAAVPGRDEEVGRPGHADRLDLGGRVRDRDERPGGAEQGQGALTTKSILAAFKTGSNHPNFLSHPYTCNGQAIEGRVGYATTTT